MYKQYYNGQCMMKTWEDIMVTNGEYGMCEDNFPRMQ